jgi:hypothetical protein
MEAFDPQKVLEEAARMPHHNQLPKVSTFDHSQCSDCSLVYTMANDCAMHLAAAQYFAQEGSLRLQRLLKLRQTIQDNIQLLEQGESNNRS